MNKASEAAKRGAWLAFVRQSYSQTEGITFRVNGVMGAAMVGTKDDGSVWVWDEITQAIHQVGEPGTVDPTTLPEQGSRGRPVRDHS